jgi:hypothetical protein
METIAANLLAHRLKRLVAETTDREKLGEEIRRLLELERTAHASNQPEPAN